MTQARETVAGSLGVRPDEITFTSGATESNNTAIFGAVKARQKQGNRIVTTAFEHPSVLRCMEALEKQGFEVVYLSDFSKLDEVINEKTILVSMMAVNNETGAQFPVKEAAAVIKRKGAPALLHCDAVQAYGKLPLYPKRMGIDLMSVSAHKLYGPKGVGALYVAKGVHIKPLLLGGGQESGMRSGTENLPGIVGFGAAVAEIFEKSAENRRKIDESGAYLREKLAKIDGIFFNSPENAVPYICNISMPPLNSETVQHDLERQDIYVSAGSACSAKTHNTSHVLRAMGLSDERVRSALRISLGIYNTKEEIDKLCDCLQTCRDRLAHR
jgi:cysteine desulfurase